MKERGFKFSGIRKLILLLPFFLLACEADEEDQDLFQEDMADLSNCKLAREELQTVFNGEVYGNGSIEYEYDSESKLRARIFLNNDGLEEKREIIHYDQLGHPAFVSVKRPTSAEDTISEWVFDASGKLKTYTNLSGYYTPKHTYSESRKVTFHYAQDNLMEIKVYLYSDDIPREIYRIETVNGNITLLDRQVAGTTNHLSGQDKRVNYDQRKSPYKGVPMAELNFYQFFGENNMESIASFQDERELDRINYTNQYNINRLLTSTTEGSRERTTFSYTDCN